MAIMFNKPTLRRQLLCLVSVILKLFIRRNLQNISLSSPINAD